MGIFLENGILRNESLRNGLDPIDRYTDQTADSAAGADRHV